MQIINNSETLNEPKDSNNTNTSSVNTKNKPSVDKLLDLNSGTYLSVHWVGYGQWYNGTLLCITAHKNQYYVRIGYDNNELIKTTIDQMLEWKVINRQTTLKDNPNQPTLEFLETNTNNKYTVDRYTGEVTLTIPSSKNIITIGQRMVVKPSKIIEHISDVTTTNARIVDAPTTTTSSKINPAINEIIDLEAEIAANERMLLEQAAKVEQLKKLKEQKKLEAIIDDTCTKYLQQLKTEVEQLHNIEKSIREYYTLRVTSSELYKEMLIKTGASDILDLHNKFGELCPAEFLQDHIKYIDEIAKFLVKEKLFGNDMNSLVSQSSTIRSYFLQAQSKQNTSADVAAKAATNALLFLASSSSSTSKTGISEDGLENTDDRKRAKFNYLS